MPRKDRSRPDESGFDIRAVGRDRLRGSEIGRGLLAAAPVGLNLIGDLLTLREAPHSGPLDGTDVHEHIPAALIRLDEAVALCFVEPLHSSGRHWMSFHGRVHKSRAPERAQARLSIIWRGSLNVRPAVRSEAAQSSGQRSIRGPYKPERCCSM